MFLLWSSPVSDEAAALQQENKRKCEARAREMKSQLVEMKNCNGHMTCGDQGALYVIELLRYIHARASGSGDRIRVTLAPHTLFVCESRSRRKSKIQITTMKKAPVLKLLLVLCLAAVVTHVTGKPCTTDCESCEAKKGAFDCCGITDEACATCAKGEKFWPCQPEFVKNCKCIEGTKGDDDKPATKEQTSGDAKKKEEKNEPVRPLEMATQGGLAEILIEESGATEKKDSSGSKTGCFAVKDALGGVRDQDCIQCGNGYKLWPCNTRYCTCEGRNANDGASDPNVSSNGNEAEASSSDPQEKLGDQETPVISAIEIVAGNTQCFAVKNALALGGVRDEDCLQCGEGYTLWPCNTEYCTCEGKNANPNVSSNGNEADAAAADPAEDTQDQDAPGSIAAETAAEVAGPEDVEDQGIPGSGKSGTAQADTTSYQVGNVGQCGTVITQELLDGPHPPAACQTCECGKCYKVCTNIKCQKVKVVDLTGTTTFEIAGKGPPGPSTGSYAWQKICPTCDDLNTCQARGGRFNGSYCSKQKVKYEEVRC